MPRRQGTGFNLKNYQICSPAFILPFYLQNGADIKVMNSNWVVLVEADNDLEADIICGFLREKGIPAQKKDSSPYAGAMRVIGGQALEVQVLVPEAFLSKARVLIKNCNS